VYTIVFAQHHCDGCMSLKSIYMLVKVLSDIIIVQRCLNDIIMFWEQKGTRLRGMPHTYRRCDSAYCCADLSHQHDVCHLKQTRSPQGAARKYLTTVTDVIFLNYAVGLDVARGGHNPMHRACGLVNYLLPVFLYNYSSSRQNSCQT